MSTQAMSTQAMSTQGMSTQELAGTTALVTGASRGFGRGIATALCQAGARVVGVARDRARLEEVRSQLGDAFTPVVADVTDPVVAGRLIDAHRPRTLVLNAGASPLGGPSTGRPGRASAAPGRSTSGRRSTGPERRCSARSARAAR